MLVVVEVVEPRFDDFDDFVHLESAQVLALAVDDTDEVGDDFFPVDFVPCPVRGN